MPIENQNGNVQKSSILPENSIKRASEILLGEKALTGTDGEKLRTTYNAEKTMGNALSWFLNDGFEIVDTDKNGFLDKNEINLGRAFRPKGVNREVLRFLNGKNDSIQRLSNDEFGLETSGSSQQDIALFINGADDRFNESLSCGFLKALQTADQKALESVVFEFGDRTRHLTQILGRVHNYLPGGGEPGALGFGFATSQVHGRPMTTVTINNKNSYKLHISTDPLVPSTAEKNQNILWGQNWAPTTIKKALSNIGGQACYYFWIPN